MNKDEICLCIFLVIGAIVVFFIYRQKVSSEGYTEQDLTKIIGNSKSAVRRQIDDLVAQAEKKIKASTNEDKINQFEKLIMENVNLEGKLEKQKELNNELQQQNKKLDKNNKELIKLLHQAATEGVSPASAKEAAAALI